MFIAINRLTVKRDRPFVWYNEIISPCYSWKEKEMLDLYEEYIGELKVIEAEKYFLAGYYLRNINGKEIFNYLKETREGIKELRNYKNDCIDEDKMIIYIKVV